MPRHSDCAQTKISVLHIQLLHRACGSNNQAVLVQARVCMCVCARASRVDLGHNTKQTNGRANPTRCECATFSLALSHSEQATEDKI